jgi:hypothetical protein
MHTRGQDDSERNLLGAKLKKWKKKTESKLNTWPRRKGTKVNMARGIKIA